MLKLLYATLFVLTSCGAGLANKPQVAHAETPVVYFTPDISADSLEEIYKALDWSPVGKLAIKVSTGEPPNSNYLRPELIGGLVRSANGTIVDCNTAYKGARSDAAQHMRVAEEHGYAGIADVDILDADGSITLPIVGGSRLAENFVGARFTNYGSCIALSHFKGHRMAGFGGAIKNISIGFASSEGKAWIHTAGKSKTNMMGGDQDSFLEAMGDAAKSISDAFGGGGRIVYINVMNRLSVDCDCNGDPAEPAMRDIGILASRDPLALDQACIDLVYAAPDGKALVERIESKNGLHTLEHAEKIGLGSRKYKLVGMKGRR